MVCSCSMPALQARTGAKDNTAEINKQVARIKMDNHSRQEFIRAAVNFLQNPKLTGSPLKEKLKFLKDKGLNEIEVDEALNLALVNRQQPQNGRWNFLLMLGLCIGGYKLYRAYLEQRQEKETTEKDQPTLNDIVLKVSELKKQIELQRVNLTSEVQSLKTLLLGHERFAAPPVIPAWQLKDSGTPG